MTRDDITRMAKQAGGRESGNPELYDCFIMSLDDLKRFADLVAKRAVSNIDPASWMSYREGYAAGAAAEREACVKVCDTTPPHPFRPSIEAAHAIRARSKE